MALFPEAPFDQPLLLEDELNSFWKDWFKEVSNRLASNAAPVSVTVGASPFTYQNTYDWDVDMIIQGGTVSLVQYSRDNATFYNVGVIAGMVRLSPGDYLVVTYTVAPTMTAVVR